MTAVSPGSPVARKRSAFSLRWTVQGRSFELRSSDTELMTMAGRIFSARALSESVGSSRAWLVDQNDSDQWRISGSSSNESLIPMIAESREMTLVCIEMDAIDFLVRTTDNSAAVHGALLSRNGRGVIVVGPCFAGKSTLATALWKAGWSLMSDDVVFIDEGRRVASPAPRRISLRFESRALVGDDVWNRISATPSCVKTPKGLFFHAHELSGLPRNTETPLAGIVFLARRGATVGSAELRTMNAAKAALALIPYAFNVRTLPLGDALRRIGPVTAAVPAFDLGRGNLDDMVNAVERFIG